MELVISFLVSVIRQTVPILFVALGVLVIQRAGILMMAAEGKMLISCFITAVTTFMTGSVWLGVLAGTLGTGLVGLIYSWIIQEFHVNQIITGITFNTLAMGITSFLYRQYYAQKMDRTPLLPGFTTAIAGFTLPVYFGFLMVLLVSLYMSRTNPGLKLRAVGENPLAAETVGLNVKRVRYWASFIGSLLIGFGGVFFTLGVTNIFAENITNGRGYIAMTAVAFGRFTPVGTLLSVALFGAGDALQFRLQATSDFPHQFARMLPYIMTVVALVIFARNPNSPSSLGRPYSKSR